MFNKKVRFKFAAVVLLLFGWGQAQASAEMGQLEMTAANGQKQTALLLSTAVSGSVSGLVASITVEQSFSNQTDGWVHGRYVFPLPEMAAVNDLEIHIGERIIRGEVLEKQAAKRTFEAAKKAGKKAGLLEQHRANLFSVNLANIAPGEKITTRLTYVDQVVITDNVFELRLPTTLTPRYISGQPLQVDETEHDFTPPAVDVSHGWAQATQQVPDAADITPPQAHNLLPPATHRFTLDLRVDPGVASNGVSSSSHRLHNQHLSGSEIQVSLQAATAPLDRDLILQWQARDPAAVQAALFQQKSSQTNEYYNLLMVMPPQLDVQALPRDVTFIVDTSGSMGGTSMEQAKKALLQSLGTLSINDRFNVIEFNSRFTTLFGSSQFATPNNILKAQRLTMSLGAGGGTEMAGPLKFAMQQPADEQVLRQIIFITDGSVGNEAELFKLINSELGDTRLFTVAIGSAPNNYFMRKAARFGRGFYLHIGNTHEVSEKVSQLSRRIQQPVMQNVSVDWPHSVEQFPQKITDLYAGEPLVLIAKSSQPIGEVTVSGQLQQHSWQQKLQVGPLTTSGSAERLNTVWARAKVESLMDSLLTSPEDQSAIRDQVIQLGVEHRLATKFTSFIAVEQEVSRPKEAAAKHSNVPNLMPHGSTMLAPQTATPAALLKILGGLLLLLAIICQRLPGFRWPAEIA